MTINEGAVRSNSTKKGDPTRLHSIEAKLLDDEFNQVFVDKERKKRLVEHANYGLMIKQSTFIFLKKKFQFFLRTQGQVKKAKNLAFNFLCQIKNISRLNMIHTYS